MVFLIDFSIQQITENFAYQYQENYEILVNFIFVFQVKVVKNGLLCMWNRKVFKGWYKEDRLKFIILKRMICLVDMLTYVK